MDIPVKTAVTRSDGAVGYVTLHDMVGIRMPSTKSDAWDTERARREILLTSFKRLLD